MQKLVNIRVVSVVDTIDDKDDTVIVPIEERIGVEALATIIMNFDNDGIKEYDEMVGVIYGKDSYTKS